MKPLSDPQRLRLFEAAAGKILILAPANFEIVSVSNAYLKATRTREDEILGKHLFDVFPDVPEDPDADGSRNLLASLQRVKSLKIPDIMGVQRYPLLLPDGRFEERYWSPVNSPVLDDAGEVEFIIHRVEDVTDVVRPDLDSDNNKNNQEVTEYHRTLAAEDIVLRPQELRRALSKLQEQEARTRTAEQMLNLGTWELNLNTGQLAWSERLFDIYGLPGNQTAPDLEDYFNRVHPDDRAAARAVFDDFTARHSPTIEFEHRIVKADGSISYIKGMGERYVTQNAAVVVGFVQDVSAYVRTQKNLTQAEQILHLAGQKVRLGGWRIELDPVLITWTPETAAIHEKPAGYSPSTVEEAIAFYSPGYRDIIKTAFEHCVMSGSDFDVICQLITANGNRLWVRSIGVAERDKEGKTIAVQGAFQDISLLREAQDEAQLAYQQRIDVLESISDAFFTLNEHWNFTYLNQQAELVLARSRNDLLGNNIWSEFPAAVNSVFQQQYQHALEHQETVQFDEFYPPLNKWFNVSAYPVPDGLAVYFRDMTADRERQQQLRLIEAALERLNDVVIITAAEPLDDPDGPVIVYVNDAFERTTGYSRNEAVGWTPRFLQGPDTDAHELKRISQALRKRETVRAELINYTKTGTAYWLEIDIAPLFDNSGNCTHYVAVERNITERKRQEADIRLNQDRFRLISQATNDVIWDWDFTTGKVWWNDLMYQVFQYKPEELEPGPESWTRRIHRDDLARVEKSIHEVIDGIKERWSDEYRFIKGDGQVATVIDRGFVIRTPSGKPSRMLGSMLDITERMELENRLRESQKLETIGHLTGGVAHDFNNLLTVIMGNAEELADRIIDSNLKHMAEMTVSAAARGAQLTNRLLAFARRQPLEPKPTDINEKIQAMGDLIRRTLPENIEFEFMAATDLAITELDGNQLDSALLNLVVNARDAMPDGGKLTIETTNTRLDDEYASHHHDVIPGDYAMVCVTDTGVGMDDDTLNRAIEPFFTTKGVGKGSGLGLSMVFGFTKQTQGHIKLYSEVDEGTAVKLYFPMSDTAVAPDTAPVAETKMQGGDEHILVVEDDDLVREHVTGQLQSFGYRVTSVNSGPDALTELNNHPDIDLLLTDIIMRGGMNGRELSEQAQNMRPSLKVLFTSGYTENAIVHQGRLDSGVELLSKPYRRAELASKVRNVLKSKSGDR